MGRVRLLDDATVNKIAAGEVVERPASVVKELVENALDAGATSVVVSVWDGGRSIISVRDDGSGMPRDDAQAAFARHATSKISSIDDLDALTSYGFRGEALSSIASVSKVVLRTREHGADGGTEVRVTAGKVESVANVGAAPGTEITVEEMFFNIPARRKSLKGKAVELAHCREVMVDCMLCRPGLSFTFRSDDKVDIVHSPAEGMNGSLASAFGPKVAENMLSGSSEGQGIRAEANLARLEHTHSSSTNLHLFVNDRPVRGPKVVSAVVHAFGSKLMKDRYPMGVLRLFVDPSSVDVNVHPAKREVRFEDDRLVAEVVESCVQNAIAGPDLSFRYDLTKFASSFQTRDGISDERQVQAVQETLRTVEQDGAATGHPLIVPLAQIMNTYILAESGGNLLLIDQHAASERIVYERVLRSMESGKEVSQRLLTPLVITLTSSEASVLEENRDALGKAGFVSEPFGGGSHALRSIPTVLGVAQGESAFRNLLGDLARMAPEKKLGLEVIWRVACHTAIRAGESLSGGQMRQLVHELVQTESPYTCEHGRPTMIVLSPADLERLFKRRV